MSFEELWSPQKTIEGTRPKGAMFKVGGLARLPFPSERNLPPDRPSFFRAGNCAKKAREFQFKLPDTSIKNFIRRAFAGLLPRSGKSVPVSSFDDLRLRKSARLAQRLPAKTRPQGAGQTPFWCSAVDGMSNAGRRAPSFLVFRKLVFMARLGGWGTRIRT